MIRVGDRDLEYERLIREVVGGVELVGCSRRGTDWPLARSPKLDQDRI